MPSGCSENIFDAMKVLKSPSDTADCYTELTTAPDSLPFSYIYDNVNSIPQIKMEYAPTGETESYDMRLEDNS